MKSDPLWYGYEGTDVDQIPVIRQVLSRPDDFLAPCTDDTEARLVEIYLLLEQCHVIQCIF